MIRKPLYPLVFAPRFKEKIWGGDKIRTVLGKQYPDLANCGETWEISAVPGDVSVVAEGLLAGTDLQSLVREYGPELLGKKISEKYGDSFPLLVKFISAADDLSIQVHPDDEMARKYHGSYGKTEMWYVLDADPGSRLVSGFVPGVTREKYLDYFRSGRLEELLCSVPVEAGDCFYLPPGRVHSIGRGILVAEIQQSSDVTYRIYDYDRTDGAGNRRELHVEKALEAMDFSASGDPKTHYPASAAGTEILADGPYFATRILRAQEKTVRKNASGDSFIIYVCTRGEAELHTCGGNISLHRGQCALVPACIPQIEVFPAGKGVELLETQAK